MVAGKAEVFGGAVWGGNPKSEIRVPSATEAQTVVLSRLLDAPLHEEHRNPLDWFVSVAIHAMVVALLILAPLYFTQVIDVHNMQLTYLVTPAVPAAPTPPPPVAAMAIQKVAPRRLVPFNPAKLTAPAIVPSKIVIAHDEPAPDISEGVVGGITGGVTGGVLGGIIGGTGVAAPVPPPVAAPAPAAKPKETLRIGGNVKPPRKLFAPAPNYPPLARSARIHGDVAIEAVIDEHGNIVNARAVSGPALLIPEALRTVMLWKYEPTYLNGVPYPVTMTVTMTFSLPS